MVGNVMSVIGILLTLVFIAYLVHLAVHGDPQRQAEVDAREYFRRHGRWPDEDEPEPA